MPKYGKVVYSTQVIFLQHTPVEIAMEVHISPSFVISITLHA